MKRHSTQVDDNIYVEGKEVLAKNEGNKLEKFYIDKALGEGKYKLRRGAKGSDVLEKVFSEGDLSEE